jgi:formylglycine-generating enzyme
MKKYLFILSVILLALTFSNCKKDDNSSNPTNPTKVYSIETVLIPAGTFQMGTTGAFWDEYYLDDEKPVHTVNISRAYYLGKYEVTQKQWRAVMGTDSSYFKGDNLPVEQVSWYDAVEFCNKLSEKDSLTKCYTINGNDVSCNWNANGWRLPTEAEWEYACKAGTTTNFYSGSLTNELCIPIDDSLDRIGWYCGNSNYTTHPVGLKEPNAFGLYDMSGNVYEWCWDWYSNPYYTNTTVTDPRGANSGTTRVLRGGSWYSYTLSCRSSNRFNSDPDFQDLGYGFRICRTY